MRIKPFLMSKKSRPKKSPQINIILLFYLCVCVYAYQCVCVFFSRKIQFVFSSHPNEHNKKTNSQRDVSLVREPYCSSLHTKCIIQLKQNKKYTHSMFVCLFVSRIQSRNSITSKRSIQRSTRNCRRLPVSTKTQQKQQQ